MSELVDIYNNKKEKTGKVVERKRGASLEKDEYIISVTCWIINNEEKILLTQRKIDKHNGGMWEPTTGLVISGESSLQGILRELNEEIGIKVNAKEIKLAKEIVEKRSELNFFRDIYLLRKDIKINDLVFSDGEVVSAKYVTIEEFKQMITNKETFEYLKYFIELYKQIKNNKWLEGI